MILSPLTTLTMIVSMWKDTAKRKNSSTAESIVGQEVSGSGGTDGKKTAHLMVEIGDQGGLLSSLTEFMVLLLVTVQLGLMQITKTMITNQIANLLITLRNLTSDLKIQQFSTCLRNRSAKNFRSLLNDEL